MPRHQYKKTPFHPDLLYQNLGVSKLINYIMEDGKKSTAQKIVYDVFEKFIKEDKDPVKILNQAISNVAPTFEVKPRRLGGASYLVPVEVRRERKVFLALNWIIQSAQSRPSKEFRSFKNKLYIELKEASENQGQAVAKKIQTEKLAESNKAFAHLKW